jgi:hypothetical protein
MATRSNSHGISTVDNFVDSFSQAISDRNAAVFAGAGLSIPAGMVNWKALMKAIAHDVGLDVAKEDDLVALAQYHVNRVGVRHKINQALVTEFSERAKSTTNHGLLASLPIRTYWTTNFDHLIEEALRAVGKKPDVKSRTQNLAITAHLRDCIVYKMHGDVDHPDEAVITKDDYETYQTKRQLFSTALQGDLVSKTFLFVGFSFNDPNLNYILGRIRILLGVNQRQHYALLRRVQRLDFKSRGDYLYALAKQDLQVQDLTRYGIAGVLVDDYKEYTNILGRISARYKRTRVFISGSAHTYGSWSQADAEKLISGIGQTLSRAAFGVVSGFGEGVGSLLLNGVLNTFSEGGWPEFGDRLTLRPFPLSIRDAVERKTRWTAYRKAMLSRAGMIVFLFGNKCSETREVVHSDGMEEEFRIARSLGLVVLPVGCTGYVAAKLHSQLMQNFDAYYPNTIGLKGLFRALGKKQRPERVVKTLMELIVKLKEG